ncbi:MAG: hypothetical protein COB53_00170 [Elusimicrobia bacterium]|nr:MAG: hypothetical protein COB53_00170 [Elusimicrobiota bacterium]
MSEKTANDRWPHAYVGLFFVFAVHVLLQAMSGSLGSGMMAVMLLVFLLLTVTGCGRILLRSFRVRGLTEPEKTIVGATLGLGLLSQGLFFLALIGWLKSWSVSLLLGAFWVIGFTEMRDLGASLTANRNLLQDRPVLAGGVLAALAILLWLCFVPPHQYDALVYHLPLAADYAREGRIIVRPELLFSHFPQNGEMLYSMSLLLGSDLLAQMMTWLGTFLTVWWTLETGKRLVPVTAVLLACFLIVTHTAVMLLTPIAYVECLVMLWVTAAVFSFIRWRIDADEPDMPRGWLALAGVFAGIGIGTKYYAGIVSIVIGGVLLGRWIQSRLGKKDARTSRSRLKDGLLFFACSSAAGLPWLIKNWFFVGDPVFPFFYQFFSLHGVDWAATAAQRYFEILTEYGHQKGHFLVDLMQFPYLAATGSTRFGGGADVLGGLGWALSFAAAPLVIWGAWRKRALRWILGYCLAHGAIWFSTGVVLRFLVVLIPLWSLLAANGLHALHERLRGPWQGLLTGGVTVCVFTNLALFLFVHAAVGSLDSLTGMKSREQFLDEKFPYYACARAASETLPEDVRVLVVGEQRGYFLRRRNTITTPMAPNRFVKLANKAPDPVTYAQTLRDEGYSHLLFVPGEGRRLDKQYGVFHFNDHGKEVWKVFSQEQLEQVFESPERCMLYRIR